MQMDDDNEPMMSPEAAEALEHILQQSEKMGLTPKAISGFGDTNFHFDEWTPETAEYVDTSQATTVYYAIRPEYLKELFETGLLPTRDGLVHHLHTDGPDAIHIGLNSEDRVCYVEVDAQGLRIAKSPFEHGDSVIAFDPISRDRLEFMGTYRYIDGRVADWYGWSALILVGEDDTELRRTRDEQARQGLAEYEARKRNEEGSS